MNNKVKELLLERFEIISRAADDCTYILTDSNNLSSEELEHKLYTRLDRINSEAQDIDEMMKRWFAPTTNICTNVNPNISYGNIATIITK